MLYNIDNQYYFCLSSALFLPDAVARVEAFALGRQEKEVISEADVSSPENFFCLEGYNSRGCAFRKSPQRRLLGVADRAWKSVERFVNDQVLGVID
ncbi:hypothetical protein [Alloprevotella tannerae]|uniref:hypothetical protein n=1 Tax=Alloprevotella tannerae TaxID=76122 RepID=UPI0028EE0B72|nr:hypothetical protein [Alloprevotella tannerae]